MGTVDLPKNPSFPYQAPAVGLRNAPAREELQQAVSMILKEETGTVMQYLMGKLPAEAVERLNGNGGLEEALYGFIHRHYREIFNRYAAFGSGNDALVSAYHAPRGIGELLHSIDDAGKFNTGEIENSASAANTNDLETYANAILRHKTGMNAFFYGNTIGSVVKCVFRDNAQKPGTVTDVKFAVNVPDSELINPIFFRHAAARYVIKDLISRHVIERIDREIDTEEQYIGERVAKLLAEPVSAGFNPSNVRESIETIRTRGFNEAAVSLAAILDNANMSYQFIENITNQRHCIIREYETEDEAGLPDERYRLRLRYFDREQLAGERGAYDAYITNFENEVQHLWDLIEVIYQDSKSVFKVNDFEDLAKKNKSRIRDLLKRKAGDIPSGKTLGYSVEPSVEKGAVRVKLARMHERIKNMYEFLYPVERRVMEERLAHLETESLRVDFLINPHYLQPGLFIDMDITSIKRKKTTLDAMTSALNEFLALLPETFQAAALAAFGSQTSESAAVSSPEKSQRVTRTKRA